jgi:hypothetical protein
MQVVIGSRDAVYMVMEFVEHDLKYVLELQSSKKTQPFSIGQVRRRLVSSHCLSERPQTEPVTLFPLLPPSYMGRIGQARRRPAAIS